MFVFNIMQNSSSQNNYFVYDTHDRDWLNALRKGNTTVAQSAIYGCKIQQGATYLDTFMDKL